MIIGPIVILAAVISMIALWLLPKLQVRKLPDEPKERFEVENEARKTVAQILSALFFFGTLFFTWQSYELSKKQAVSTMFATAVTQIAHENIEVRLGGIFSLESISRDSPDYYWPAMELLTAYVRRRSSWPEEDLFTGIDEEVCRQSTSDDVAYGACQCDKKNSAYLARKVNANSPIPSDIQAVLSVLGRRKQEYEKAEQRLDLRHADLRGADMKMLHFERTLFAGSNISNAELNGSFLLGADLTDVVAIETLFGHSQLQGATLEGILGTEANFYQANLSHAIIREACLDKAQFGEADLLEAKLDGSVTLRKATLFDANLRGVSTEFANFEKAEISGADFTGADMNGIYLLTCEQIKTAKTGLAKRQPQSLQCK